MKSNELAGFNIRISTMCSVSKGVFLLKKGHWRKVPNKLENFNSVFDVMQSIVVMKVCTSKLPSPSYPRLTDRISRKLFNARLKQLSGTTIRRLSGLGGSSCRCG